MINLETARVRFRQWEESDWPAIAAYYSDPEQVRFLGGVIDKESSWRLMASYIGHYHLKGFSYMALEEKNTGKLLGTVGLWDSGPWPETELGYWLLKDAQGKGYASEAATVAKQFAFETLGLSTLVSYIDAANQASQRVAEKLGGSISETIELLDFGPHDVYRYLPRDHLLSR